MAGRSHHQYAVRRSIPIWNSDGDPNGGAGLWRGSLPPFECAALVDTGSAARPNGAMRRSDKPPRHTSPLPQGIGCVLESSVFAESHPP
ncbi:hypothetical protein C1X69_01250 [Pseudomonas sp. FW305-67]|nr:hypothetical protein C1X70_14170 [Pseudomonas sp. FW305-53]PMY87821.1 hypothetical protein C1X68_07770 [Pseudomonas sp. FW303-C2]PMY94043.1 hypothetical protein C1X67_03900 [Pseudomonas sp. FW305-62]PNA39394.1 hypothetical protein C1X71_26510 [Pseudomonas sp. FW306-2-2C-A10BC]PNA89689.1 hypothetical protein C1X66_00535 [Pseudomonas sp. MPR-R3B]PNB24264.1 hypothetical protein C1X69_01250 [Pseudomonas sp. FW305-67]